MDTPAARVTGKPGILADIAARTGLAPTCSLTMPRSRAPFIRTVPLVCALLLGLIAGPAAAWGKLGHRLVGSLAADELSPSARAEVGRLLAGEAEPTLAGVSTWADELRDNNPVLGKRTSKWHYVNIAEHGCTFDANVACAQGDCVVGAISVQTRVLGDRTRSVAERRDALKFVVHFIGDVHQPLHAGYARDKGGNDVQVQFDGRGSNLHSLWDSGLLYAMRLDETAHLQRLRALPLAVELPRDGRVPPAGAWAEASCRVLVQPGFYPASPTLDSAYPARWSAIVDERLRHAGTQLAAVLNASLDGR